jgi:hypothetical protein
MILNKSKKKEGNKSKGLTPFDTYPHQLCLFSYHKDLGRIFKHF